MDFFSTSWQDHLDNAATEIEGVIHNIDDEDSEISLGTISAAYLDLNYADEAKLPIFGIFNSSEKLYSYYQGLYDEAHLVH